MFRKTTRAIRGTSRAIEARARELRSAPTSSEQILWAAIRRGQLDGLSFRRQHPIGRFILDFYCPAARLVIELDGSIHAAQRDRDAARDADLEAAGYRLIRIDARDVDNDLPSVLERIRTRCNTPQRV